MQVNLRQHIQSQHKGVKFNCDKCPSKFSYKANLSKHALFKAIGRLKEHRQSIHEGKRFPCDKCDFLASYKITLNRHYKNLHKEKILIPCDFCGHKASNKFNLEKHKKRYHTQKIFKCHHCDDESESITNLWIHIENVHKDNSHHCDECSEKF